MTERSHNDIDTTHHKQPNCWFLADGDFARLLRELTLLLHAGVSEVPVSGLVVTLVDNPAARETSLAVLREHPALEIGEPANGRVPVVVDSLDENEDRLIWEWLHSLPGVALVVVAFISFDDESPPDCSSGGANFLPDVPLLLDREL